MKKVLFVMFATVLTLTSCGTFETSEKNSSDSDTSSTIIVEQIAEPETETKEEKETESEAEKQTEVQTTIAETTEVISNDVTMSSESSISAQTTMEYVERINEAIQITDINEKLAVLIGATDGCSFHYNDLSFELYLFPENSEKIKEAKKGTFSFTIEGFGDFTMNSRVNGNFVLLYNDEDANVINAFYKVN